MLLLRKRLVKIAFVVSLMIVAFLWTKGTQEAFALVKFKDISGHWAETSMLEMNAYDLIQGYPDGQLKPDRSVSLLEAIKMILNTVGLGEVAKNTNFSSLYFSPEITWGKEYLAVALQKKMLTKQDLGKINPNRPVTRSEFAYLLCLALDFEPDYSPLSFADTAEIKEEHRGYVGKLVNNGIIKGLPGNIFAPNREISRAQITTILLRLIEEKIVEPPPKRNRVSGWVTEVNLEKKKLKVKNLWGENEFVFLPDSLLLKKGQEKTFESITKGERVKLIVDAAKQVRYAALLEQFESAAKEQEGFIVSLPSSSKGYSLILESDTKDKFTFGFLDDAQLIKGNEETNINKIKEDSYVEVSLDKNGWIFKLELFEPQKVGGTIINSETDKLRIKVHGVEESYRVSKNVRVTKNLIRNMAYQDLKKGDRVEVLLFKDTVFHIDYLSDIITGLSGMISKVQKKYIYIYVQNQENRYEYNEQIEIIKKGKQVDTDELKRGEYVFFEVDNEQKVIYLETIDEEEGELEGIAKYLFISDRPSITLINTGGLEMDYDLDSDACFLKDGDEINLEEIVPGAKVRIKIEDKKVVEIEVLDDLNITIDGRIIKFNEEKYRLTLEINGRKYSYDVSKKLDIIDNKKTGKKLTEMEGYWIKAYLVDGEVSKIEIL